MGCREMLCSKGRRVCRFVVSSLFPCCSGFNDISRLFRGTHRYNIVREQSQILCQLRELDESIKNNFVFSNCNFPSYSSSTLDFHRIRLTLTSKDISRFFHKHVLFLNVLCFIVDDSNDSNRRYRCSRKIVI